MSLKYVLVDITNDHLGPFLSLALSYWEDSKISSGNDCTASHCEFLLTLTHKNFLSIPDMLVCCGKRILVVMEGGDTTAGLVALQGTCQKKMNGLDGREQEVVSKDAKIAHTPSTSQQDVQKKVEHQQTPEKKCQP